MNAAAQRPRLIVNGQWAQAFQAASTPCGVIGLLEERGTSAPFLALRPGERLIQRLGTRALGFGHALLGERHAEVLQFGVTFFENATYHLLINPNNPVVQAVLGRILDMHYYFVLVIDPNQAITAFRAELDPEGRRRFGDHWQRTQHSTTTDAQYLWEVSQFARNPFPPGRLVEWVCRDNQDHLNLTRHRLEMSPMQ